MEVFPANGLKEEEGFEGVGDGDGEEKGDGEEPENEIDERRDGEEVKRRAGGEGTPENGLAAETETHAKATDGEAQ